VIDRTVAASGQSVKDYSPWAVSVKCYAAVGPKRILFVAGRLTNCEATCDVAAGHA
jgi:hypothetical protein